MKATRFATVACGLVLAAALALQPGAGGAAEPLEIDVVLPMTGQVAFVGQLAAKVIKANEDAVNKTGGIGGRPVTFNIRDDASNPQNTVQLINEAIARGAQVVLGPSLSSSCGATLPLVKNGPVAYCFSPGVHPEAGTFMFSADWATTDTIRALIHFAHAKGWTRVGILVSTDASGQDGERNVDAALALPENSGMTVVAREHFAIADLSVAAQLSHIKAANPQVLFTWASGTPFGTLVHGLPDAGIDVPTLASNANLSYSLMHGLAQYLPKELYFSGMVTEAYLPGMPRGAERSADEDYLNTLKSLGMRPEEGAFLAWDATKIVVAALRKLGPTATATQIRAYIDALQGWVGVHGAYDFRKIPQRGLDSSGVVIVRWSPERDTWVPASKHGGTPL